jgi:colanic acid/amylovoran biosynthesis glycosyltransferase
MHSVVSSDKNIKAMKTVVHYRQGVYLPITATWIYSQIKNLRRYQPIVYALGTENLDIYPTSEIRSLGLPDLAAILNKVWEKLFGFYPFFANNLRKDKPDIVHAHFGPAGYNFLKLKEMYKTPLITTFYGYDLNRLPAQDESWKKRYKVLFQKGECFLVEGNHMKKSLVELGCPEEKVIVQHLGVDVDRIKFVPRRLEGDEFRILIAGNFVEKKGIPYAVEAFGRVKQNNPGINMKLTIIGDSPATEEGKKEKTKIRNVMQKYSLVECTNMLGYQPHSTFLDEIYNNHIFISPSIHAANRDTEGGLPVAIIEASASGMIVLSTNHCDIPEAVLNGESGYLVPERDVNSLVNKLEYLVSRPDIWESMGKRGRRHIEENYNVITQVQKLEKIYDVVLNKM